MLVSQQGLRWVWGSDDSGAEADAVNGIEDRVHSKDAHRAQAGLLADMDHVADIVYDRVVAPQSGPVLLATGLR
jgi:hypothetical protein